jgi:hypothetical protein
LSAPFPRIRSNRDDRDLNKTTCQRDYLPGVAVVVVSAGVVVVELLVVVVVLVLFVEDGLLQPTVTTARLHKTNNVPIFFIVTPFLKT